MGECIFNGMIRNIEMAQTEMMSSINVFISTLRTAKDTLRSAMEQGLGTVEQRTQAHVELGIWKYPLAGLGPRRGSNDEDGAEPKDLGGRSHNCTCIEAMIGDLVNPFKKLFEGSRIISSHICYSRLV